MSKCDTCGKDERYCGCEQRERKERQEDVIVAIEMARTATGASARKWVRIALDTDEDFEFFGKALADPHDEFLAQELLQILSAKPEVPEPTNYCTEEDVARLLAGSGVNLGEVPKAIAEATRMVRAVTGVAPEDVPEDERDEWALNAARWAAAQLAMERNRLRRWLRDSARFFNAMERRQKARPVQLDAEAQEKLLADVMEGWTPCERHELFIDDKPADIGVYAANPLAPHYIPGATLLQLVTSLKLRIGDPPPGHPGAVALFTEGYGRDECDDEGGEA